MTEEEKRQYLYGDSANYQIPLSAIKTNLWPRTIVYDMESRIGEFLSLLNLPTARQEKDIPNTKSLKHSTPTN